MTHSRRTASDSARPLYLRTPAGFERMLKLLGQPTDSFDPPPAGWDGPPIDRDRHRRLFHDLGIRRVAVSDAPQISPTA